MSGFANSLIGISLGGYSVKRMIARGGMGIVYEGVQESLGRRVAVKVLYPHLGEDESFRDRFQREARAIAQLRHQNIVGIIDFGTDQGFHYMVMELIDGPSLRDELARRHDQNQPFTTDETLEVVEKIATALSYAHGRGYVHRDVKPANVMLDEHGEVFLTDFGLVKLADSQGMTMTGAIVGTPEYMAPEQSLGSGEITAAADQYSLAVVAYQLFVGRVPFKAPTPVGVIHKHISEPPPPPHTIVPWFPPEVERVLMRGLAKDPAARYPSIDAFFQDLKTNASGMSMTAVVMPAQSAGAPAESSALAPDATAPEIVAPVADPVSSSVPPGPRNDPDQLTSPVPVLPTAAAASGTAVVAGGISNVTQSGATISSSPPVVETIPPGGSGSIPPPPVTYPGAGDASGGRRKPLIAALIALALLLLVGGIAAATLLRGDDPDPNGQLGVIATNTAEVEPTATTEVIAEPTATEPVPESPTPEPADTPTTQPTAAATATELPTQPPTDLTPTQIRRLIPTSTPFTINPTTPTPTEVPPPIGEVTGPAATVEMRNYLSVPAVLYLVDVGALTLQPGEFLTRPMPAGTWRYVQSADGYSSLEGTTTWEADNSYVWEFYDPEEVEIVEIINNFPIEITLEFDGYGPVVIEANSRRTRVFPAREYIYTFRAEGYQDYTSTVVMDAGARTTWPWNPS